MKYRFTKIILTLSCVVAGLILSTVVYEYSSMKKMGISATNLENEAATEKQSVESFAALAKTASNIKGDSEKANSFFIKRDDVVDFLDLIGSLSSTTGAEIVVQSVNEKKTSLNQPLLSVGVNVKGSYSSVYYSLRMLEELPYQTEIQSVKLSSQTPQNSKSNIWSADVNLVGIMF